MARTVDSRDFRLLWSATTVSNLGDGIRVTALPLLTVGITTDPLAVGAVTAASFLPWFLLSLVGGVVVDRVDRKRLILIGQLVRAVAVGGFGFLVLADQQLLALVYVVAFVIGAGEVVVDSAMQASVPHVAGDDLDRANSRIASSHFVAGEAFGGPIGGLLFAVAPSVPFFIDAASFFVGGLLVAAIATRLQDVIVATTDRPSVRSDIAEGMQFLRQQPVLRGVAVAVTLSNFAAAVSAGLLVLLVTDQIGGSEWQFGLVISFGAFGGLVGSLGATRVIGTIGRRGALVTAFVLVVAGQVTLAAATNVAVAAISQFIVLAGIALFNVNGQSIRQRLSPDRLLGRVIASMRFFGMSAAPAGGIAGGLLGRAIGIRPTIGVAAAIGVVAAVAIVRATAGQDLDASIDAEPPVAV